MREMLYVKGHYLFADLTAENYITFGLSYFPCP